MPMSPLAPQQAFALTRQRDHGFAWAFALGSLRADAGDGCINAVALWPSSAGGAWVACSPDAHAGAAHAIEAVAMDLMRHTADAPVHVDVLDFSIRKRFPALAQLQSMGLYRIHTDLQAAQKALNDLERLARHRHHQLLDDLVPTLDAYNLSAPRPEPYRLVVLNADDFPRDGQSVARFEALLRDAATAGIWVLAFGQTEQAADRTDPERAAAATDRPMPAPSLKRVLASLYPSFSIAPDGTPQNVPALHLTGGPGTEALAAVMQRHHLALQWAPEPLAPWLDDLRERARQAEHAGAAQDFLRVPIGTTLDGRQGIDWVMGDRSGSYHALILGMPGSGKSTLLNNLIVGIGERYDADQVRLYLMDYKDGVEFESFAQHPNVERIFLDNEDIQAATDLLQHFSDTIHERNERFKAMHAGVRKLADYNRLRPDAPLPHLVLIVDEVQRLLSDTDHRSQRFAQRLVDVTRRGRSAGVHLILATQSLNGVVDAQRLLGAVSLRVSFMLNTPMDADRVLEPGNAAPLTLRPFEFVLNSQSGRREANVLGRGLAAPNMEARLSAARMGRPTAKCLTPILVRTDEAALPQNRAPGDTPGKQPWRPTAQAAMPNTERDAEEAAVLAWAAQQARARADGAASAMAPNQPRQPEPSQPESPGDIPA